MNITTLSTDEIHRIAQAIQEDFGSTLSRSDLQEVIFTCLDNLSGLETLSESELQWLFEQVMNCYLRSIAGIEK